MQTHLTVEELHHGLVAFLFEWVNTYALLLGLSIDYHLDVFARLVALVLIDLHFIVHAEDLHGLLQRHVVKFICALSSKCLLLKIHVLPIKGLIEDGPPCDDEYQVEDHGQDDGAG